MTDAGQSRAASGPAAESARAAAERLATELEPRIVTDVEAALHAQGLAQRPEQYFDPISLGGLIVSVATLAWTVYTDLKSRTAKPAADVIARTVRVQLRNTDTTAPAQRDRVIDVVVEETIRVAEEQDRLSSPAESLPADRPL